MTNFSLQRFVLYSMGLSLLFVGLETAHAQSGSRSYQKPKPTSDRYAPKQGSSSRETAGSGTSHAVKKEVSMDGYCPVCIREKRKWVKGSPDFQVKHQGKNYYFPGGKQKQMFLANPAKYTPAIGGDCVVCFVEMGTRTPGNPRYSVDDNGRYYFFNSDKQLKMFHANPKKYIAAIQKIDGSATKTANPDGGSGSKANESGTQDKPAGSGTQSKPAGSDTQSESNGSGSKKSADLGMEGYCPVCLTEMKQWVKGDPQFSAVQGGKTYLFPGQKQMDMFLAQPDKYTPALGGECSVCLIEMGKREPGNIRHATYYHDRLYLFVSEDQKEMFKEDPAKYAKN